MSIDQEKMIVEALPSLYPLQEFEEKAIQTILDALPPIQFEIIHCKDCDWWTRQKDSCQGRCALTGSYPTGEWYCGNARKSEG